MTARVGVSSFTIMAERFPERVDDDSDEPTPAKRSRLGAFKYKTRYSKDWERKWPFLAPVPHDPHRFRCNVCSKDLSCGHQGASDVKDHVLTKTHQKLTAQMTTQSTLAFKPAKAADLLNDKVS